MTSPLFSTPVNMISPYKFWAWEYTLRYKNPYINHLTINDSQGMHLNETAARLTHYQLLAWYVIDKSSTNDLHLSLNKIMPTTRAASHKPIPTRPISVRSDYLICNTQRCSLNRAASLLGLSNLLRVTRSPLHICWGLRAPDSATDRRQQRICLVCENESPTIGVISSEDGQIRLSRAYGRKM